MKNVIYRAKNVKERENQAAFALEDVNLSHYPKKDRSLLIKVAGSICNKCRN